MRADGESGNSHDWLDDDAGPLVRSFALTGGRAKPGVATFDLLSHVTAAPFALQRSTIHLQPEHRAILARARDPVSVAELASHLGYGLGVVRVLLADLLEAGAITKVDAPSDTLPDDDLLQAVIHGLRTS
ncbi:hypothetical protein HDA40_005426 [Hamadaea flava]|uniref:DUF742 domain-containing protein n=1 Tax=Hamadaea flava TaxID=1742688 RepID=A0ABV8M083_9ACTN|nr:DUF742 domain-containing protein [Hamadaea flava]MCP2326919.1 hypothetical protein [Hamadaea flava]